MWRAVLLLIVLISGLIAGILADRTLTLRKQIDPFYQTWTDKAAPLGTIIEPNDVAGLPTTLSGLDVAFDSSQLAALNLVSCYRAQPGAEDTERDWLNHDITQATQESAPRPDSFPDLEAHPGLIKIELIKSPLGSNREHCGATRISRNWFLTAAHCFQAKEPTQRIDLFDAIAVTPREDVRGPDTLAAPIKAAFCHTGFGNENGTLWQGYSNDVALFYLEDIEAFSEVQIAPLEQAGLQPDNSAYTTTYISGWGRNGASRYLSGGPVQISQFGEALLVTQRIGETGPDVGDSGSPLYADFGQGPIVIGVLSSVTTSENETQKPATFVRVKSVLDWARRGVAVCEENGALIC